MGGVDTDGKEARRGEAKKGKKWKGNAGRANANRIQRTNPKFLLQLDGCGRWQVIFEYRDAWLKPGEGEKLRWKRKEGGANFKASER